MKVTRFSSTRFAGLKDVEINFSGGINVILGPNEAGKSTLVDAVFATMFKQARLKNQGADRLFKQKYLPYPGGDYINGNLTIEWAGKEYHFSKEWGAAPAVSLTLPTGEIVKNEEKVLEYARQIFRYGEGTYGKLVFARQAELKEAISAILGDSETTGTLNTVLRQLVMNLDGVSIHKLGQRIDQKWDDLLKRWDLAGNRPENNRGIHNPYTKGLGKVLESYYHKEKLKSEMNLVQELEKKFKEISHRLKQSETERKRMKDEINRLSLLEKDMTKRALLEPQLAASKGKVAALREINLKWPAEAAALAQDKAKLTELEEKLGQLNEEAALAGSQAEKKAVSNIIQHVEKKREQLLELKRKQAEIPPITMADIRDLEGRQKIVHTCETAMKAGVMIGKIITAGTKVWVTRDLREKEEVAPGAEFKANGYLRVETADNLTLEIKSGELDFKSLREKFYRAKTELEGLIKKLQVKSIEDAKLKREQRANIENSMIGLELQIAEILGKKTLEELKQREAELKNQKEAREPELIAKEIKELNSGLVELKARLATRQNVLDQWSKSYHSPEKVLDELLEVNMLLRQQEVELAGLASLPGDFVSSGDFISYLAEARAKLERFDQEIELVKEAYYQLARELPQVTYEELKASYDNSEQEFQKLVRKAGQLVRIKEVFAKQLAELDGGSYQPLSQAFGRYLSQLTLGNYNAVKLGQKLQGLEIVRQDQQEWPLDLLSAGTYDGVALALRLAVIETLFTGEDGLMILDDCLVDLDPVRKLKAAEVLTQFAGKHQVIFTTCDPETASLLGGNIIQLK